MPRALHSPKPFAPGAPIEWTHVYPDGSGLAPVRRTGVVWSAAPSCGAGHKSPVWVVPDERLDSDLYSAVVVAVKARTSSWRAPSAVGVDECFSDNYAGSPTGSLAVGAARAAYRVRQESAA